ncbi:MAG: CarD family transcriptional regulator [Oscillospiraceae bacterium]|nr:CarD family transcriptional regulator [Oscillospiraceae bacterium]
MLVKGASNSRAVRVTEIFLRKAMQALRFALEIMYSIGDTVVHPLHGAGVIYDIEQRRIDGKLHSYYVFVIPYSGMRLMIPCEGCVRVGVRPLITREHANELIAALPDVESEPMPNWNRRYRENLENLKSGNHLLVAGVIKGLLIRDAGKGLSSGERDMLRLAKQILISELALATNTSFECTEEKVCTCLKA